MPTPISASRVRLFFQGSILAGWCTGVRIAENIALSRADVLGNIYSDEIEPTGVSVSVTADYVTILEESLNAMGVWPSGETVDMLSFPEMTAVVLDDVSGDALYTVEGLRAESRTLSFDRQGGLSTTNCTLQGKRLYAGPPS